MYLKSAAVDAFERDRLLEWDWTRTTVLVVSYDWNPIGGGAESLAGRRLVRALLAAGVRVHVLTAVVADSEDLRHPRYQVTLVPCEPLATERIGRTIQMMRSRVPESSGPWVAPGVEMGMQLLATLPDDTIIYSRAMPGTSNIVGWHLAKRSGHPWVAHFSDEWPSPEVLPPSRKILAPYKWPMFVFWRRRVLRDAHALTFTNPGQAADMAGRWPNRYLHKSFVVTHLASVGAPPRTPAQYDRFHIVHTGNFYNENQTSSGLMQGLRLFLDHTPAARDVVRFTQAGWSYGDLPMWAERCGLGGVVHLAGRLREEEVLRLLDSASLLVGIDFSRADSTTLLSKLPDYINARRPILAIASPTSTLGRVCREDGAGLTADHDAPEQVAEQIGAVFDAWQRRKQDAFLPGPRAIAAFGTRNVLTELAGAFTYARGVESHRLTATVAGRSPLSGGAQA